MYTLHKGDDDDNNNKKLQVGAVRFGIRISAGAKLLSLLQNFQTGAGPTHPLHNIRVPGTVPTVSNVRGLWLTTHFHLVFRLRMSGTVPLRSMYAFGAGVETAATAAAAQFSDGLDD
jgi:hypothetical protein